MKADFISRPDTQSFIQKLEQEMRKKEQGQDNRGFFQKYVGTPSIDNNNIHVSSSYSTLSLLQWMYIVPAVIFYLMMSQFQDTGRPAE